MKEWNEEMARKATEAKMREWRKVLQIATDYPELDLGQSAKERVVMALVELEERRARDRKAGT